MSIYTTHTHTQSFEFLSPSTHSSVPPKVAVGSSKVYQNFLVPSPQTPQSSGVKKFYPPTSSNSTFFFCSSHRSAQQRAWSLKQLHFKYLRSGSAQLQLSPPTLGSSPASCKLQTANPGASGSCRSLKGPFPNFHLRLLPVNPGG